MIPKPTRIKKAPKPLKKVSKTDRAKLVKKLDDIVSLIIRLRNKHCVVCGTGEKLNNGHVFSREAYSTRWDISYDGNCHTQCNGCNLRHEYDPYPYNNWYIETFGKEKWDALHFRFRTPAQFKTWQLEELYEELKEVHAQLQTD